MIENIFRNRNKGRDPPPNEAESKLKMSIKILNKVNVGLGKEKVNKEQVYSAKTMDVPKLRNAMTEN